MQALQKEKAEGAKKLKELEERFGAWKKEKDDLTKQEKDAQKDELTKTTQKLEQA